MKIYREGSTPVDNGFTGLWISKNFAGYMLDGEWHCDTGGPAVCYGDGTLWWYDHGIVHRDDGPAYIPGQKHLIFHDVPKYRIHGTVCTRPAFELYYMLKYRKPYDGL